MGVITYLCLELLKKSITVRVDGRTSLNARTSVRTVMTDIVPLISRNHMSIHYYLVIFLKCGYAVRMCLSICAHNILLTQNVKELYATFWIVVTWFWSDLWIINQISLEQKISSKSRIPVAFLPFEQNNEFHWIWNSPLFGSLCLSVPLRLIIYGYLE